MIIMLRFAVAMCALCVMFTAAPEPARAQACAAAIADPANSGRPAAQRPWMTARDAIWYNHPDQLAGLLSDCVRIDEQDQYGWTLLHQAVDRDRVALAKLLIERGAKTNIRNKDGKTAPQLAASAEMKALFGAAALAQPAPAPAAGGRANVCNARHNSSAALCGDTTCKMREYRKWQTCLKTGSYY